MNELRWILAGFAVVILAVIYLWGRRAERRTAAPESALLRARPEPPTFAALDDDDDAEPVVHDVVDAPPFDDLPSIRAESRRGWTSEETLPLTVESRRERARPLAGEDDEPLPIITVGPDSLEDDVEGSAPVVASVDVTLERHVAPRRNPEPITITPPPFEKPAPSQSVESSTARRPARPERRKIFALRLSAAEQKFPGVKLKAAFDTELLHHGKYGIFHRRHLDGATVFSVADISEPGHFDLATMEAGAFAGVTLFAQLPGPLPAEHTFNDMLACASRLQQAIGGRLQDERGLQLTSHRAERIREEVRDFERSLGDASAGEGLTSAVANPS